MFCNFILVSLHGFLVHLAQAPSFSVSFHRRKFDTILMLVIGIWNCGTQPLGCQLKRLSLLRVLLEAEHCQV